MSDVIRILIADDHTVVRRGLHALIATEPGMEIVGEVDNGLDAVHMASRLEPDVILLDLMMPQMNGLEAISLIRQRNPDARILILTSFADDDKVFPAIKAGALGYLLKDSSPSDLLQAIRDVSKGGAALAPSITLKLIQEAQRPQQDEPVLDDELLTPREIDVLERIAQGLTNQEIADVLCISERTVRNHVGNILKKLNLVNRTQAALYALREGLSSLDSGNHQRLTG
jgi:two-component system, NarL family, response regulator LiaR